MADTNVIGIRITGDASGLQSTLQGAARDVGDFGGKVKDSSDATAALANGLKSAFIGSSIAVGIIGIKNNLIEMTQALVNAQIQADKLRNGLNFAVGRSNAGDELAFIRSSAQSLGLEFVSTAAQYTKVAAAARGTSLEGQKTRDLFLSIAQASTVMGLSAQEAEGALLAVTQMISKGKVQAEELRGQLGERLPGAFQIAARAMGVTTAELDKMLSTGQVLSEDFLPKFTRQLTSEVAPEVEAASKSMQGSVNRLANAWTDLKQTVSSAGVSDAIAAESRGMANYLVVLREAMERAKASGAGAVSALSAGLGTAIARTPFDALSTAANALNGSLNLVSLGALKLKTDINLLPSVFETNAQKAALLGVRLSEAEAALAKYQERYTKSPENTVIGAEVYQATLLVNELRAAKKAQDDLRGGGAGRGSVNPELVGVGLADRARREDLLKGAFATYATDSEKLNAEIAKQKLALGDLYTPELEQRIRAHFIKPVKDGGNAFADQQAAAKEWAKFYKEFIHLGMQADAETVGLNKSQEKLVAFLQSPAYTNMGEGARQLALGAAYAAVAQEQLRDELRATLKEAETLQKAYESMVVAQERGAGTAGDAVRKQREQNAAIGKTTLELADLEAATLRLTAAELDRKANLEEIIWADGRLADATRAQAKAMRELADEKVSGAQTRAAHDAAQKAADEWKRAADQIENSITDALMRGFESGKGFAENLRDTVVNMFKTMVLRPVVEMGVRGSLSVLGLGGASGAASAAETAGNSLSTLSSLSGITNWLTDFGSAGASAIIKGGQIAYNAGFETIGRSMMSLSEAGNFSAVANGLNAVGNGLGYLNAAMAASKGQWGRAAGSAIGTWFGGPIGGAIGNAVGGWVDESFSGGHEYTTGTGIAGKFSGNQFAGRNYQDWRNDGSSGFFGIGASGSSSGTNYSALDSRQAKFMGAAYGAIITQTADFASALGASASTITGYQKDIKLALGSDAEANKKAIADLFKGLADEVAATVLDGQYIREGEGAADTLARLATNLAAVNGALGTLGGALLAVGQSGGDMASSLVDLFGGLSQYQSAIGAYYQAFYSLDEQRTQALANLIVSLNDAGIALPASRDAYRALVDAQDLATESGRKTYATLIGLSGAFASVTAATDAAMKSFVADGAKLQVDLLTAQGDTAGARAAQRALDTAGLSAAATAQYDYNQSLRDQISAANAAAAAAQNFVSALGSIAATRQSLEAQLLGAQGDTAGALALTRKNELASLTQGLGAADAAKITAAQQYNYALEDQIAALQNAKTAAEASARAQEEASRAADQLRQAWQSVTDSIFGEVKRIRDLMGGNSAQSYAQAQARFSITAAQASAGDQEAAKLLPSLSQALLTLAEAQATSLLQLRAIQGQTAGTLERIGGNYTAQYGLTVPKLATGTNYVPQDMLALIHQGEAVVPARYNPATGGGDNAQLVAEIQALRVAVAALQKSADTTADATSTTSKTLLNVTLGGVAMQTEAV